jgi:hypothetical protein
MPLLLSLLLLLLDMQIHVDRRAKRKQCGKKVNSTLVFRVYETLACVCLQQLLPEAVRLSKHFNDVRLMGQSV